MDVDGFILGEKERAGMLNIALVIQYELIHLAKSVFFKPV